MSLCPDNIVLGVGKAVRFHVVGTISREERPPRDPLDGAVFDFFIC